MPRDTNIIVSSTWFDREIKQRLQELKKEKERLETEKDDKIAEAIGKITAKYHSEISLLNEFIIVLEVILEHDINAKKK